MFVRGRGGRGHVAVLVLLALVATACGGTPGGAVDPSEAPSEAASESSTDEVTKTEAFAAGVTFEAADDPTAVPALRVAPPSSGQGDVLAPSEPDTPASSPPDAGAATEPDAPEATEPPPPTDGDEPASDPVIEDGRHPVFLVELDVPGRSIAFDVIQFLTGDEAIAAYEEDVPEDPDVGPPNDYWIRNVSPRLRTLPIVADVTVTVIRLGGPSGTEPVAWTLEELPAHLAAQTDVPDGRLGWNPFWLTVEDGVVVAIDEQYLP